MKKHACHRLYLSSLFAVLFTSSLFGQTEIIEEPVDSRVKTVEEAFEVVRETLGNEDAASPMRFKIDIQRKSQPDQDDYPVLLVTEGTESIGQPYVSGEAVVFDSIAQWKTDVFDFHTPEKKVLSSSSFRHNTVRFTLRRIGEQWFFESQLMTHNKPSVVGKHYHRGSVIWHADGFELAGIVGVDKSLGPRGRLIPVVGYEKTRFRRDRDNLVKSRNLQHYEFLQGPDSTLLPLPDFARPIGQPFEHTATSEGD